MSWPITLWKIAVPAREDVYKRQLYMSAIAGIDQELYEAGAVDGLGRWGMVKHITLPSICLLYTSDVYKRQG